VADFAGHPYLVSEYVQGRALHQLERPMPSRKVLDIALDLTRGLAAAHRRGVLHRDIKPANAILTDDGRAKLLDFGLAMIMDGNRAVRAAAPADAANSAHPRNGPTSPNDTPSIAGLTPARHRAVRPTTPSAPLSLDHDANASRTDSMPAGVVDASSDFTASQSGMDPYMVGTPMYMAPEVWRGEPATRRSDLYSLGILLYELLAGAAPFRDVALSELSNAVQQRTIPRLGDISSGVYPALAAIVDRLIERDPRDRYRSADALLLALEECAAPSLIDTQLDGNPYRGLAAFESAHASLFFGRRGEARELIDRVRVEAFVVVGGDSGTGKSSLCKAGVLHWLSDNDGWSCVEVVPGRHPVRALAAVLAPWAGTDEAALADLLRDSPDGFARAIRHHLAGDRAKPAEPGELAPEATQAAPRRLLLFVDQLEELLTLAAPDEARAVATALAALAVRSPWVRVLTTARSDFLSRLAMLPGLGEEIAQNLYFLRPLTGEHIREVIVRPAAAKGVVYESEALIDTLVAQTEHAPGGLPLLQFTLAELWDLRDVDARTIRAESLAALSGVGGALTRHADRFLAGLGDDERDAARRILLRLVTAQGTRTRRSKAELVTEGAARDAERAALEVLVRGRLLVANNTQDGAYEIAHEALLTSWSTLQGWLQRDAANHALHERVEQAAAAWERMGRPRDLLWGRRQLAEARVLDRAVLAPGEAAFLAAAGQAIRRKRIVGVTAAAVLLIGAVSVGLAIRAKARRELDSMVADQTRAATDAQLTARKTAEQVNVARKRAFELFDTQRWPEGEQVWGDVEAMALREEEEYRTAFSHLESVLLVDPRRAGVRTWAADLMFERLVRAERNRRRDLWAEFKSRLLAYDDGRYSVELHAEATVQLSIAPESTQVWLERDGVRVPVNRSQTGALVLQPGSVVLSFEAPGHVSAHMPLLLARGETRSVRIALPTIAAAPPGLVYVPAGRFLFGSEDGYDARRGFLNAAPLHDAETDAYFIGRYEVTFGEWIEFLDDLPVDERRKRSPQITLQSALKLTELAPHRWKLTMTPSTHTYTAQTGERLHYLKRSARADQDWTRFPVSAVSFEDAIAYAGWLDRTHRLPGARLCNEYEWERAARGADDRIFPSGAALAPDDANIDVTYGREPLGFGPDEVGSHPRSRSPFGAEDMAGNVWEWAHSVQTPGMSVIRGGSWYLAEISARTMNREYSEPTMHNSSVGVRLCVTAH
jgi:formylglycine-generating enzyme required for sulfatase activity